MNLPSLVSTVKRHHVLRICAPTGTLSTASVFRVLGLSLSLPIVITFGAVLDGTWHMTGTARGLSQHYGVWSLFVTCPLMLILTILSLSCFATTMDGLHKYSASGHIPDDLADLVRRNLLSIALRTRTRFILILFGIIGFLMTIVNIRQTMNPVVTYGNVVFDSPPHMRGFLLHKFYLFFLWTFVYPTVLFITLHLTVSLVLVLRHMCLHDLLRIDFFDSDNCGGVSIFGSLNTLMMGVYACFFAVIVALHETHRNQYYTLLLASIVTSLLFFLQSIGTVYYIHKFIVIKRSAKLEAINKILTKEMDDINSMTSPTSGLLSLRAYLLSINTYPYSRAAMAIVNALRFAPTVFALFKILP
jgi:hypothetical protein